MVINGESVMEHDTRKMIYNHITVYPGVPFGVLKKVFDLSKSTLRYHLQYLEKAESIFSEIESGKRCYYPQKNEVILSRLTENHRDTHKFTKLQKRILSIIQNYPGINQKELVKKANLSRFTITYNLNKFIDLGIIRKVNDGSFVYYECITDDLMKHEILKTLIIKLLNDEIDEKSFNDLKEKLDIK